MLEPTKKPHTNRDSDFGDTVSADEFFKEIFGDRPEWSIHLAGLRHRENLTQVELGKLLGLHQSVISQMETGKRSIGKRTAKKLAEFFDTDYRYFL